MGFGIIEKFGEKGKIFGRIGKDLLVFLYVFFVFCEDLKFLNLL